MKLLPKLCAALVACATFLLVTDGAWADEIPMEKTSKKGAGKHEATAPANSRTEVGATNGGGGSGKAGSTTSANKMEKKNGKQPHKQAPVQGGTSPSGPKNKGHKQGIDHRTSGSDTTQQWQMQNQRGATLDQYSRSEETVSNMSKSTADTAAGIIPNMKP